MLSRKARRCALRVRRASVSGCGAVGFGDGGTRYSRRNAAHVAIPVRGACRDARRATTQTRHAHTHPTELCLNSEEPSRSTKKRGWGEFKREKSGVWGRSKAPVPEDKNKNKFRTISSPLQATKAVVERTHAFRQAQQGAHLRARPHGGVRRFASGRAGSGRHDAQREPDIDMLGGARRLRMR